MTTGSKQLRARGVVVAATLLLLAFIAARTLRKPADAATQPAPSAVLVDTAKVAEADVPVYVQGLGTVQAFYTVTVTARVDGELQQVAFTEGQNIKRGELLAQIDPRPAQAAYDQALATKTKDQAMLENARRDLDRYTLLQPQDLASKQTVDTARAAVDQLKAQIQVDQAVIDNARTQLAYTRIVSPIDGRTGIRLVDPGNIVRAADATGIVVVTELQPIAVIFTLPQEQLLAINEAMASGAVEVTTLSRDGSTVLDTGRLLLIDNTISTNSGTAKLKAVFDNKDNRLWPGQYVNARVRVRTDRHALTLPSSAVQRGPSGVFTYVVKNDSTVEARALEIGEDTNGVTVVKKGLQLNENVVTTNQYRLQPGAHVRTGSDAVAGHAQATS